MSKDQSREVVYGMPYDEWRKKFQKEASSEQKAAFEKSSPGQRYFTVAVNSVDDGAVP